MSDEITQKLQKLAGLEPVRYTAEEWKEKQINDELASKYEEGELKGVDILLNEGPMSPILEEMFTGDENPLEVRRVIGMVKHLQGKVLTVLDATFTDEKRIKYVKDLIKECFSSSSNWLYEMSIRDFDAEESTNEAMVENIKK